MTAPPHIPIVSVDDHLIEPPDLFEGRMPAALRDVAPKVVTMPNGRQVWEYEGRVYPNVGLNAVIGRPKEEWSLEPANFDEMRKGCWDIDARVADMDLAGIEASVCFPSLIAGFAGTVFSQSTDPALGEAQLAERCHFVMKFQQLTGPVMAKGVEDTAFYISNRLIALNEVGGDPADSGDHRRVDRGSREALGSVEEAGLARRNITEPHARLVPEPGHLRHPR